MKKHKTRVFIVDDDSSFRNSLKRMLRCKGIVSECFESAGLFLDSVPSGQKGIAVVDIHMPVCDGFFLMDKMDELGYAMPVILVTGQTGPDTREKAMQRGAAGFLQKPFYARSLMALIEELEEQ